MDLVFSPAIRKAKLKMDENSCICHTARKLAWILETSPGVASDSFPFHWHAWKVLISIYLYTKHCWTPAGLRFISPFLWWILENGNSNELIASTQYKLHYVRVNQPHIDRGSTEININESKHVLFHSGKEIVNFIWWCGRFWCSNKATM